MVDIKVAAAVLLIIGGLVHGFPPLYTLLTFGGVPWIQIIVGWISVLVGLAVFFKKK